MLVHVHRKGGVYESGGKSIMKGVAQSGGLLAPNVIDDEDGYSFSEDLWVEGLPDDASRLIYFLSN